MLLAVFVYHCFYYFVVICLSVFMKCMLVSESLLLLQLFQNP